MRNGWLFLLLFFTTEVFGQVEISSSSFNFGSINEESKKWVDFEIKNVSSKHFYLMRSEYNAQIKAIYTRGKIEKDSSAYVRVMVNPQSLGPFNEKILLYISALPDPVELTVKGVANYVIENNDPDCPDFSSQKPRIEKDLVFVVNVRDGESGKGIKNAQVLVTTPHLRKLGDKTGGNGSVSVTSTEGMHSVYIQAEGYETKEIVLSGTFENNYHEVQLNKSTEEVVELAENQNLDEQIDAYIKEELGLVDSIEYKVTDVAIKDIPGELSRSAYRPNNIVFLMDVSSSMNKIEKLDLLKLSVNSMLSQMRDIDRIAIISYASSVNVLLPSTSGKEKEMIMSIVNELTAEGLTAGSSGIKSAYEIAFDNFIGKGNNQVIITTDGAFNVEREDYNVPMNVRLNALKGVTLSVVGVKTGRRYIKGLKKLAKMGRGRYIHIKDAKQAETYLLDEIKENSRIR